MHRKATRAAICIHVGSTATAEQQEKLAAEYCERHGIEPTSLVFSPADAIKLIRDQLVDTIIVAYTPADRAGLAEEVLAAGGELREARPGRRGVPVELVKIFVKLFDRGMSIAEIAALTDAPTGEIRAALFRKGRRERSSGS